MVSKEELSDEYKKGTATPMVQTWRFRKMVELNAGMLLLVAQRGEGQNGRRQDTMRGKIWCAFCRTDDPVRSQSPVQTQLFQR